MSIVINTPSGNIGRHLAKILLDAGESITVISRSADRVKELTERGARLVHGSTDDPSTLDHALRGARALFWVTPPPAQPDFYDWALGAASSAAHAARKHGVKTAVVISSVGAHTGRGTGPVGVLLAVENEFQRHLHNVAVLRAGFFMENLLRDIHGIANGAIYSPLPPDMAAPMVATRDIAAKAASYLLAHFAGHVTEGVHGPRDLTQLQVAAELSRCLGRSIHYQQVPVDAARQAMLGFGMPEFLVNIYCEMYQAIVDGRMYSAEPRTPHTTTPTTLHEVIETVIKPALQGSVSSAS
jgi:uncharacterized protein YbjT (DUF2867 family)